MAGKRIDSIIVKEAIEKELQFLASNLDELTVKLKSFPAIRIKSEGAGNMKELSKAQIAYAESLKSVEQLVKQRMASEAKLITLQTDYAVAISKNRVETQKLNQEQKAAAQVALSQEGSIERARAKIKHLSLEQTKLNLVTAEGRKRNDEINKSLEKYTEFIRKNVSAAEKQRMNVGNYQGSAKIIVDAMERARAKVQQVERDFGKIGPEARAARGEFEALRQITADGRFLNIAAKVGDTNKELRFFTQQLNALEDAGMKNSQVYADVRARLAQLTDQIGDTRSEVKALSSDTRNFDLFAGSVNFAADAFQTFAGAAALAGASEEQVAEQIRTLVAIQSIANGVKGIANELTTKGTAANKAYAFVQNLVSVAMDKSAVSAARLQAAMGLIAIAATVIGAIVVAYTMFSKSAADAEKSQAALNKVTDIAIEKNGDQIAGLQILIDKIKAGGLTQKEKTATLKDYNEKLGDTLGKFKTYQELEAAMIKNGPKYIAYLVGKAKAEAAYGLLIDEYKKRFEKERAKAKDFTGFSVLGLFFDDESTHNANKAKALKQADDDIGVIRGIYKRESEELAKLGVELNIPATPNSTGNKRVPNSKNDQFERERKAEFELRKLALERLKFEQEAVINNENFTAQYRISSAEKYALLQKQILKEAADFELENKELTASERQLIEAKKADDIVKVDQELTARRLSIADQERQGIADIVNKGADDFNQQQNDRFEKQLEADQEELNQRILQAQIIRDQNIKLADENFIAKAEAVKGNAEEEEKLQKELNERKEEIEQAYQRTVLANQIAFLKKRIALFKAEGKDVAELEAAVARAEAELANAGTAQFVAGVDKKAESLSKLISTLEIAKEKFADFSTIVTGLSSAIGDREKNRIQEQLDNIEKWKAAEIDRITASGDTEEKKAAKIKLIEAKAAADRERLERRKREEDIKSARLQKALTIMQIILTNALNIAKAVGSGNPAKIIYAIAIGAAQLAVAIATPIPQFAKGKSANDPYEGPGIAGEAGRELLVRKTGEMRLIEKPTLLNLAKGDIIHPNRVTEDMVKAAHSDRLQLMNLVTGGQPISDLSGLEGKTDKVIDQLRQLNKKPMIIQHIHPGVDVDWVNKHLKY